MKVFWLAGGNMNKFHAFPEFSTRSLCFEWTRERSINLAKQLGLVFKKGTNEQSQKCKQCMKVLLEKNKSERQRLTEVAKS